MTSITPRSPYTKEELDKLYPDGLKLQLVQILLRHGERSPVSARFQNAGLPAFWPYCRAMTQSKSAVLDLSTTPAKFTTLEWKHRLETFGKNDEPIIAKGPKSELDAICEMGRLTDTGRETTFALGTRLRNLYVDQLKFLPANIANADSLYLRASPIPRALDSLQETLQGLYPLHTRAPDFPPPAIITRGAADETLFPNDSNCRRFAALSRAFAQRAADRWNTTPDMDYLNKLYGKWMPEDSPRVGVDSHPRLSGVMDTINSTLAHGPETRLPKEFYDKKGRKIIEKIGTEEWFAGYKESQEYRMLGIGGLMGDIVSRMVGSVERSTADGSYESAEDLTRKVIRQGTGAAPIRFGLSGCHDTTLAGVLASLGAFDDERWPPYTSHIAVELFRKGSVSSTASASTPVLPVIPSAAEANTSVATTSWTGWLGNMFGSSRAQPGAPPPGIGRKKTENLTAGERATLEGYYVRLRYNDEVVTVPGCKAAGNHLEGDESFCTLAAFKAVVDKYVPVDWRSQCRANIGTSAFPSKPEPAGY